MNEQNKILVLGHKGMLGGQLMKVFSKSSVGWDKNEADITDFKNLKTKILSLKNLPVAILNCVAYNDVDSAETNTQTAFLINSEVPKNLCILCKELSLPLIHFSTNYIFDGVKGEYKEDDLPNPLSVYGQSKYQGEQNIISSGCKCYIIRTSVLFGPKAESELAKKSFVDLMLDLAKNPKASIKAVDDEINSLTYAFDLAVQTKLLLEKGMVYGIYHITNSGEASWYEYAREIFQIKNLPVNLKPVSRKEFPRKAITPKKAVLVNTKLPETRTWKEALKEFLISNFQINDSVIQPSIKIPQKKN